MNKAYKFRIYPNKEQKILFAKTFGCVRLVYNYYLNKKITMYKEDNSKLSYTSCSNDMTILKKMPNYEFLSEVDSISLQQSLRHLDNAFKNFFSRPKMGFPKFKSKRNKKSYTTISINNNISIENGHIKLPKIGLVKIKQHRVIPTNYKLKSATVSQAPTGNYYVSVLFEYESQIQKVEPATFVGLDFSMKELYVSSDGKTPNYPRYYRQMLDKLKRECRKLSLMTKGSNNRNKQRIKVAKLHEKIANQRLDFLHKQSRQITNAYDLVCIEDLNMQAMSQALKFGKSVADNGWGMFVNMLTYKLCEQGKQLVKIDKWFPSSKTCSVCGCKKDELSLSERTYICDCGNILDRDTNAAINIKNEAIRMLGIV